MVNCRKNVAVLSLGIAVCVLGLWGQNGHYNRHRYWTAGVLDDFNFVSGRMPISDDERAALEENRWDTGLVRDQEVDDLWCLFVESAQSNDGEVYMVEWCDKQARYSWSVMLGYGDWQFGQRKIVPVFGFEFSDDLTGSQRRFGYSPGFGWLQQEKTAPNTKWSPSQKGIPQEIRSHLRNLLTDFQISNNT